VAEQFDTAEELPGRKAGEKSRRRVQHGIARSKHQ
jgi:hypothetical protein